MPLNDEEGEFDNKIEDEDLSIYPPPGVEIGTLDLEPDRGSGSYAQDGPLEVAEDRIMMDGESQLGSAAMYGPTEIGGDFGIDAVGDDEVGDLEDIGAAEAADREGSEIGYGYAPMEGESEIGNMDEVGDLEDVGFGGFDDEVDAASAADRMASEIGAAAAADRVASEIGSAAMYGQTEIGQAGEIEPSLTPFDLFMEGETRMGNMDEVGDDEIGAAAAADREGSEIFGAEVAKAAVVKVIEKARDNRQPAPPMRAVSVEAPARDDGDDWALTDVFIGAAEASGHPDPFPLMSQLLLRCGAGGEPRFVRVDTEESYKAFRAEHSPEMAELSAKVAEISQRLEDHVADPEAHSGFAADNALSEDIEDLTVLGAEVDAKEEQKRIELWMPKRFDGLVTAWREGDFVCASLTLPGSDGEVRICTSLEPVRKCVAEMSRHAAESGVHAATVVGVLPAMGCVLGAGTALKEMAAAAPSILQRPEAARKAPFMVRIEPKTSPALAALAMLVMACRAGNQQACVEWERLGALAPAQVRQAMVEALQVVKAAA